jgi:hypothetical protein
MEIDESHAARVISLLEDGGFENARVVERPGRPSPLRTGRQPPAVAPADPIHGGHRPLQDAAAGRPAQEPP